MPFDTNKLDKFPTDPGVYIMQNSASKVIYVGKAINLRNRVRQYFAGTDSREIIPHLLSEIASIETVIVLSEKEALLLENTLIKEYQPKYNALLKDDKTYLALKLTTRQSWPVLSLVRYKGKPKPDAMYFGPYTSAYAARQTFDLLNRLFPLRQCSDQEFLRRTRPCILYDMKRCLAPCVGKCTSEEYQKNVERNIKFLRGHDKEILKDLYADMDKFSEALEFENAAETLKTIRQIEHTIEKQHVHQPLGGDTDALAVFRQGEEVVLCQMIYREGKLMNARNFNFSHNAEDDEDLITSFLIQHYQPKEDIPHEILLPIHLDNHNVIEDIISENKKRRADIYTPSKGGKLSIVTMALANATAFFKREKDATVMREKALVQLQEMLHLTQYPRRMECFDNSNIAGTSPVSAMVTFTNGQKDTKRYRKYHIRDADPKDDYAVMNEVLTRRYRRAQEENDLPDLIIIDGGKGHLNIALKVLASLDIVTVHVIGVAKDMGRHDKGMSAEQVYLPGAKDPIIFKHNSSALFLLQQIRDEAHRVAISFHRKSRSKKVISSKLRDIAGIGPAKHKLLLRYFGSIKQIQEASREVLEAVPGLTKANVEAIWNFFHKENNS